METILNADPMNWEQTLRDLPERRNDAYKKSFDRIQARTGAFKVTVCHLLSWVFRAKRQVRLSEVEAALQHTNGGRIAREVMYLCEGLLFCDVDEDRIRWTEPAVAQFFEQIIRDSTETSDFLGEAELALACLKCIESLPSPERLSIPQLERILEQEKFLKYACEYWASHWTVDGAKGQELKEKILAVFKRSETRLFVHDVARFADTGRISTERPEKYPFLQFLARYGLKECCQDLLDGKKLSM